MKNKKGISIGRILLYVLFLSLIALFVYTLFITYKALKKKKIEYNSVNSSLRFAYNNNLDYSAVDYITDISYSYSIYNNFVHFSENPFLLSYYGSAFGSSPIWVDSSSYKSDNVLNAGKAIYNFTSWSYTQYVNTNSTYFDFYNSSCLIYKCDIPISLFKGYCNGSCYNGSNSNIMCFYVTELDIDNNNNITNYHILRWRNFASFDLSTNLDTTIASATKVKYFGFGSYCNSTSNVDEAFLPIPNAKSKVVSDLLNSYNNETFDLNIIFDVFTGSNDYQQGYEAGYKQGRLDVDNSLLNDNLDLINQVSSLQSQVDSLNSRVNQQSDIINQLNNQLQQSENNFKGLFFTFADIPFRTVSNALGFEFWGINLFRFFVGIITALGIVWLIKKII